MIQHNNRTERFNSEEVVRRSVALLHFFLGERRFTILGPIAKLFLAEVKKSSIPFLWLFLWAPQKQYARPSLHIIGKYLFCRYPWILSSGLQRRSFLKAEFAKVLLCRSNTLVEDVAVALS